LVQTKFNLGFCEKLSFIEVVKPALNRTYFTLEIVAREENGGKILKKIPGAPVTTTY